MKTILILGGAKAQVIAIETAKKMGYKTILCDRSKNNPGREIADVFYAESITDKKAILDIAKKEKVDGITSYASDVALTTIAYVSEQLNLPTNPYKAVETLSSKELFRHFLKENGFNTPLAKGYGSIEEAISEIDQFKFPVMVKPVDSSGSRGVSKLLNIKGLKEKLEYAFSFSQKGKIIIEEYIEGIGKPIAGDGIAINGKFEIICVGKQYFNNNGKNKFVPIAESYPYGLKEGLEKKIKAELQRLIDLLKIKSSVFNLEIRVCENDEVYLMEVAPRNGGNSIPKIVKYAMDIPILEIALKMAVGEKVVLKGEKTIKGYWSNFAINSNKNGKLKNIIISEEVKTKIVEQNMFVKKGGEVSEFLAAGAVLGVLIMKFSSREEMLEILENSEKWIQIEVY